MDVGLAPDTIPITTAEEVNDYIYDEVESSDPRVGVHGSENDNDTVKRVLEQQLRMTFGQ